MNSFEEDSKILGNTFLWFGQNVYNRPEEISSLYVTLCTHIANDPQVLRLVRKADRSQQIPHLLFAAVQYLLIKGTSHPLVEWYPNLCSIPQSSTDIYPIFQNFCLLHAETIEQLVMTRRVQTNEVRRCTAWVPTFTYIASTTPNRPLALIEIGASAGLNLLWDRYAYCYGAHDWIGNLDSIVRLTCNIRGMYQPPLPPVFPSITTRVGIDLFPIELSNNDAITWLQALIWPEHRERARLLMTAIEEARQIPFTLLEGDGAEMLTEASKISSPDALLCIYHSYTLNQMSEQTRKQLMQSLLQLSYKRPFVRASLEWYSGQTRPQIEVFFYDCGVVKSQLLAYSTAHGHAIEWL